MKKSYYFLLFLLIQISILSSCKKEGVVDIQVSPENVLATPKTSIRYFVTITPDNENKGELGNVVVYCDNDEIFNQDFTGKLSQNFYFDYTVDENATIGDEIKFRIVAVDNMSGLESEKIATIEVVDKSFVDIAISPQIEDAVPGDTINYQITLTPDTLNNGSLSNFYIFEDNIELYSEKFSGTEPQIVNFDYIVSDSHLADDFITLNFIAEDDFSGNSLEKNSYISVVPETFVDIDCSPTVAFAFPSEYLTFSINLIPEIANGGELGKFRIISDGEELYNQDYSGFENQNIEFVYTVPLDALNKDIILKLYATDGISNRTTSQDVIIHVSDVNYPQINTVTNVTANYVSTTLDNEMMFLLDSAGVTLGGGDETDGQLAFIWHYIYGFGILSPNAEFIASLYAYNGITYTINDKEETKIKLYSGNWDELNALTISQLNITSDVVEGGGNGVQELETGDILVFETEDGRKGALKITNTAKISMFLTADIKYQKQSAVY